MRLISHVRSTRLVHKPLKWHADKRWYVSYWNPCTYDQRLTYPGKYVLWLLRHGIKGYLRRYNDKTTQ